MQNRAVIFAGSSETAPLNKEGCANLGLKAGSLSSYTATTAGAYGKGPIPGKEGFFLFLFFKPLLQNDINLILWEDSKQLTKHFQMSQFIFCPW